MKPATLAIALLATVSMSFASGLRAQVEAANKQMTTAMKKKDLATVAKLMKEGCTSDFKYMEAGNTQTIDQMIGNMKMGLGSMSKITVCTTKMLRLKQSGNNASGTMQHVMAGTTKGADKKTHKMVFSGVSSNTYRLEGGKWKMSSMEWKKMSQTMDGKPMQGMGG